MRGILGIDTSNYTTSLCLMDADTGKMLADSRKVLPVSHGQRGLRQSEALFLHVTQLPEVMASLMGQVSHLGKVDWVGVGVSVRPRPFCRSYMPVFSAGHSFAYSFARAMSVPMVMTSHQEGHLAAASHFDENVEREPWIGVHVSGGTSDVLFVQPTRFGFHVETLGEGSDLHAGQFVDRVGVSMGMPFPAGPHLEQLALQGSDQPPIRFKTSVAGTKMSFSGPCSAALRAIDDGLDHGAIALGVQAAIANSIVKAIYSAVQMRPMATRCVIVGGVAANSWIRDRIVHRLRVLSRDLSVNFAPARYSSDNALGVAAIARQFFTGE